MSGSISDLFLPEPLQWGLRGDPYLWREMAEHFKGGLFPSRRACFLLCWKKHS
jgi:hypothetical protein